jgi:hypothetical protein
LRRHENKVGIVFRTHPTETPAKLEPVLSGHFPVADYDLRALDGKGVPSFVTIIISGSFIAEQAGEIFEETTGRGIVLCDVNY